VAASHHRLLLAASHRNHLFARHHTGKHLLVVDDAIAASSTTHHIIGDDAIAAPITMPTCRSQRPLLDMDHAIFISRHRTATGRRRHRATGSLHLVAPSSTSHGVGHAAVAASDRRGSDANCWRRLLAAPLLLLPWAASHSSLSRSFSLLSRTHTHMKLLHTQAPRKKPN
jgi:hypothetical protein